MAALLFFSRKKIWVWSVPHWFREKPPFRAGVEGSLGAELSQR